MSFFEKFSYLNLILALLMVLSFFILTNKIAAKDLKESKMVRKKPTYIFTILSFLMIVINFIFPPFFIITIPIFIITSFLIPRALILFFIRLKKVPIIISLLLSFLFGIGSFSICYFFYLTSVFTALIWGTSPKYGIGISKLSFYFVPGLIIIIISIFINITSIKKLLKNKRIKNGGSLEL